MTQLDVWTLAIMAAVGLALLAAGLALIRKGGNNHA